MKEKKGFNFTSRNSFTFSLMSLFLSGMSFGFFIKATDVRSLVFSLAFFILWGGLFTIFIKIFAKLFSRNYKRLGDNETNR